MTIQISNFHVSDKSKIVGSGSVALLPHRKDVSHAGVFKVSIQVNFNPGIDAYPIGSVKIDVDLTDSFKGSADSTSIEQVNTFGKDTPTAVITGRCRVELHEPGTPPVGCRFWLLVANNRKRDERGTPDVVGFVVYDNKGNRVAYGTGPLDGDVEVSAGGL